MQGYYFQLLLVDDLGLGLIDAQTPQNSNVILIW